MGLRRHLLVLLGALLLLIPAATHASTLPPGFQETVVFNGLTNPTVVKFSPDGRVFVAEKSGLIKVFDSLSDPTPSIFADLSTNVHNFWDRGMLGFALDPGFPANPYVYVLYAHDAAIGGTAPRWGTPGVLSDPCPTPPGATGDGCVVSGRLSRLQAAGNVMTGPEQVLIEDWCQQYPSHSTGSLAFGDDGALYVSGGDGASFNFADWGQDGSPLNPCGDPPGGVGATLSPPTAEGGALRSQDLRTTADPTSLDGAILRVDPATGQGLPDNPLAFSSDPNARRIVAHGLRNPFRIGIRPHTSEVWAGDVGWSTWEEIDRVDPAGPVENFGWPCYEGNGRQSGYDGANLNICENLYATPNAVTAPYFNWNHSAKVVAGETCPTGSSSAAGIAFYEEGNYPGYAGALFFADYSRDCIWAMKAGADGLPNAAAPLTFAAAAANPVGLEIGPEGDLFYADFDGGTIRRVRYFSANRPPVAVATANPTAGGAPLDVTFNGTGSSDPDAGDTISYAWDLDEDGLYDDSTAAQPSRTYSTAGDHVIRLRVTDNAGASSVSDPVTITVGNSAPTAAIATPAAGTTWRVGDVISFSGSASDPEQSTLPASSLSWELVMQHCPSNCHQHVIQSFTGVANGSFTAPDHEYPSYLELRLTATDAGGLTDTETLRLDPQTVTLNFASSPTGLQLVVGSTSAATPFSRTVIIGSANSVSAVSPQTLAGTSYGFSSWSDGGAQTHTITAPAAPATYTATFAALPAPPSLVASYSFDAGSGPTLADISGRGHAGTISGATWSAAGKNGGALSFDGVNDWVTVADSSALDLTTAMTLEAWVRPTSTNRWRTVALKEQTGNLVYALYGNNSGQRASANLWLGSSEKEARSAGQLAANTWTHLAATYDGATIRVYVNGALSGSTATTGSMPASTGPFRIGGNAVWDEFFAGQLDDLRLYNRALSATEVQTDMATPVGPPPPSDTQAPTVPGGLGANGGQSSVALSWTASSDNVSVLRYNVHRSTTSGFTPSAGNRIAQPTGTGYTDPGLAPGTYYYRVTAEDAAGNVSAPSTQATRRRDGRHHAAGRPRHAVGDRRARHGQSLLGCRHGQRRRRALQRAPLHGRGIRPGRLEPDCAADGHELPRHRRRGHLLLPRDRGGRRRQRRRPIERGQRNRDERHVAPDRRGHRPCGGRHCLGHDQRAGECVRQRRRHERPVHPRRSGARRPRHERAVRHLVGDDDRYGGPPHPPGGCERRGRQHDHFGRRERHGRQQHTTAAHRTRRSLVVRRRRGTDGRRRHRQGAHGDDLGRDMVGHGQERRLTFVRRRQRLGNRRRRERSRPDQRDDALRLGQPDRLRFRLADDPAQGEPRLHGLRALLEHRHRPAERPCRDRRLGSRHPRHSRSREQRVDVPRSDLRRREPSPLCQRHARLDPRRHRQHERLHRPAQDRRQRDLGRVVRRPDRQRARLLALPLRRRDPERHERGRHSLSKTARGRLAPPPRVTASSRRSG